MTDITSILKPGDIILWRDKESPISIKLDGKVCGNWETAFLCLGDGWILTDIVITVNRFQIFYKGYEDDSWAVFRARETLSETQLNRIFEIVYSLTGLNKEPSWSQRFRYWLRTIFKKYPFERDHLLHTSTVCTGTDIIASAYEAAGLRLSDKHPWKMTPIDLDASDILVRVV